MHYLVKYPVPSAKIIDFFKAFQADRQGKIPHSSHILAKRLVYQRPIGKCMEGTVIMLLA